MVEYRQSKGFFISQSAFALFIYGFFWLAKWLLKQRKLDVAQQFHPIDMNAIRKTTEMPSMTFLKQRVENHSSGNKKSHKQLNILTHSLAFHYYSKAGEECSQKITMLISLLLFSLEQAGNRIALSMCQVFLVTNDSNENLFLSHYNVLHTMAIIIL